MKLIPQQIHIAVFILFSTAISSCVGPPITTWKSDTAKYKWGSVHAWISGGLKKNDQRTEVLTNVLFNFHPTRKSIRNGCAAYIQNTILIEKNSKNNLLNIDFESREKGTGPYRPRSQISLHEHKFYNQSDHQAYEVFATFVVVCGTEETTHSFNEVIETRLVQPIMWEQ